MKAENGRSGWSSGEDSALLMQGVGVRSLVREQRSKIPHAVYHGQKIFKKQGWQGGKADETLRISCQILHSFTPLANKLSIREASFYQPENWRIKKKKVHSPRAKTPHIMCDSLRGHSKTKLPTGQAWLLCA